MTPGCPPALLTVWLRAGRRRESKYLCPYGVVILVQSQHIAMHLAQSRSNRLANQARLRVAGTIEIPTKAGYFLAQHRWRFWLRHAIFPFNHRDQLALSTSDQFAMDVQSRIWYVNNHR